MDDNFEFYLIDTLKEFADKIRSSQYSNNEKYIYRELLCEYLSTMTEYEVIHKGQGKGR
jgi:hypothetical protein